MAKKKTKSSTGRLKRAESQEELIQELKVVAEKIGRTPGQTVFRNKSGYSPNNWEGWWYPVYGELVEAAGLSPNTKNEPPSDEMPLFEKAVLFIREKRKFPSSGYWKYEGNDSARKMSECTDEKKKKELYFPTWEQFMSMSRLHAGRESVPGLASWIFDKCVELKNDDDDFADVIEYCRPNATKLGGAATTDCPVPGIARGTVYLFQLDGAKGEYRVGLTTRLPESRDKENALRSTSGGRTVWSIETDDPVGLEKYWHDRFTKQGKLAHHDKKDQFNLTPGDVAIFKKWKVV